MFWWKKNTAKAMQLVLALLLFSVLTICNSLPLSTNSRWIVDDQTGQRVKLVGGNWAGHIGPMLPEGLDQKPLKEIARHIALMGFNSVRLTYAVFMYTRYTNLTVVQSFRDLGLNEEIQRIAKYNPQILDLTLIEAQKAVVDELGSHGVMVLLDCQVSKPIWCCNNDDGNGFWGDEYFDPNEWLRGLKMVAALYQQTPTVVAMSLRNELRGPRQNVDDWYRYVTKGAKTIHMINPNVLVLVSGLNYDLDFTFLKTKPLGFNLDNKLVFEAHRYAFSGGNSDKWVNGPLNQMCDTLIHDINNLTTFVIDGPNPAPLYITEFGVNQLGTNPADNNFLGCFLFYLIQNDLDWNLWALQGSYYLRDGQQDLEEQYGLFTTNWTSIRNINTHFKLMSAERMIQDPHSKAPSYQRMYHPMTGKCIRVDDQNQLHASDCYTLSKWSHDGNRTAIRLLKTRYCMTAIGEGLPVILTKACYSEQSTWKSVSNYQLANKENLCLHYDPSYSSRILTKQCICLDESDPNCAQNSQPQWFMLISSNVH